MRVFTRRKRTNTLPEPQSTDALIEELDEQLAKAQSLVHVLRERAKVAERDLPRAAGA